MWFWSTKGALTHPICACVFRIALDFGNNIEWSMETIMSISKMQCWSWKFARKRDVSTQLKLCHTPFIIYFIKVNSKINIYQSQALSAEAKSVEFLTISVHFAKDNPNPERAPYLENVMNIKVTSFQSNWSISNKWSHALKEKKPMTEANKS